MSDALKNIRRKYPQYNNLTDVVLISKVIAKYPQYEKYLVPNMEQLGKEADLANQEAKRIIPSEFSRPLVEAGKKFISPLFRPEQLEQAAQVSPIKALNLGGQNLPIPIPGLGNVLPRQMTQKPTEEYLSEQTSPLNIVSSAAMVAPELRAMSKVSKEANRFRKLRNSEYFGKELNNTRNALGEPVEAVVNRFANVRTSPELSKNILSDLPEQTIKELKKPMHGIEFSGDEPVDTVSNYWKLKKAIGEIVNFESDLKIKNTLSKIGYGAVKRAMVETVPELTPVMDAYSDYMQNVFNVLSPKFMKGKNVIGEKGLRGALRPGADDKTKEAIFKIEKLNPNVKIPLFNLRKANLRENLTRPLSLNRLDLAQRAGSLGGITPYKTLPKTPIIPEPIMGKDLVPFKTSIQPEESIIYNTGPMDKFPSRIGQVDRRLLPVYEEPIPMGPPKARLPETLPLLEAPEAPLGTRYGEGFVTRPLPKRQPTSSELLRQEIEAYRASKIAEQTPVRSVSESEYLRSFSPLYRKIKGAK